MVTYEQPPVTQPNASSYFYSVKEGVARIAIQLESGAYGQLTIPIDKPTADYFQVVADDVAKRVIASGKWSAATDNPDASNAKTATQYALLKLYAENFPVITQLQKPDVYTKWIDTCIANQIMEHMHLADALVLSINPVKADRYVPGWQQTVTAKADKKSEAAGITP